MSEHARNRARLAWAVLCGRQSWADGYPTPWAYERVCEVLRYERERADSLALERFQRDADGQRLYCLLALFDTRDGTPLAELIRAAREGWERSHPDMAEDGAWDEFDHRWNWYSDRERIEMARNRA